jgi:hypothetical protein
MLSNSRFSRMQSKRYTAIIGQVIFTNDSIRMLFSVLSSDLQHYSVTIDHLCFVLSTSKYLGKVRCIKQ